MKYLREKEISAVTALSGAERYAYFLKQVADWEEVWGLSEDGQWVLMGGENDKRLVPVWPHEAFASVAATGLWAGAQPKSIALDKWLEKWTPGILRDGYSIVVFPVRDAGAVVTPEQLHTDLEAEMKKYK